MFCLHQKMMTRSLGMRNNGSESFTASTITTSADGAYSVYAIDVDSDGDIDVLSASENDDKIAWYENNGSTDPSFSATTISTSADGAQSIFAIDVDSDGDIDVLSASENDDKIAWYENNGSESFTARTISTSADGANSVFAIDVDSDGDIDALSSHLMMTRSPGMKITVQKVLPLALSQLLQMEQKKFLLSMLTVMVT